MVTETGLIRPLFCAILFSEKQETKEPEGEPAKPDQKPAEDREKNPYSFLFRK